MSSWEIATALSDCFEDSDEPSGWGKSIMISRKLEIVGDISGSMLSLHALKAIELGQTSRLTSMEHLRCLVWARKYGHELSGRG